MNAQHSNPASWPLLLDPETGYPYKDAKRRPVIALDGEGENIPLTEGEHSINPYINKHGTHAYTLLVAADENRNRRTLAANGKRREADGQLARNYGLGTAEGLDFILSMPKDAILVGFYFSYDVVKILTDLPVENMRELCDDSIPAKKANREHTTVWNGYKLSYMPRKKFTVAKLCGTCARHWHTGEWSGRCICQRFSGRKAKERLSQRVVYDIFGFFQKSFVRALDDATSLFDANIIERIAEMKENRSRMHELPKDQILDYCTNECQYLAILFRDMLVHIDRVGLTLRRYDGPGAVAEAIYRDQGTRKHMDKAELPEPVALAGYFGGRFEVSEIGFIGDAYAYDINSAYPYRASLLPCLACGRFRHVSEYVPGQLGIYRVGSHTSGRFAPFPFRTNDELAHAMNDAFRRDGAPLRLLDKAIFYGHGGQRWVWQDELLAAREHFGQDAIPVYEGWTFERGCDHEPFTMVLTYYHERRELKARKDGAEKVYKLALNSLYGKLAQSIGWQLKQGVPVPPPYQSFIWAGMITSGTRAMILDAVMRGDVVSIATDGILSRTRIPALEPSSKELGAWEMDYVRNLYLFQSGVYCGETYDKKSDAWEPFYKTRGFAPSEISDEKLRDAWHQGKRSVRASSTATRFIPMKQGVTMNDALEYIGQWIPSAHEVKLAHTRRMPAESYDEYGVPIVSSNRDSMPLELPHEWLSGPYVPKESAEDFIDEGGSEPALGDHGEATITDLTAIRDGH